MRLTDCLITYDIIRLVPHIIYHLKAINKIIPMTVDKKPLYLYLMCYVEDKMYPYKLVSIKK